MSRKKASQIEELEYRTPTLKAEEYWEWRTTISEMNNCKEKFLRTQTELKVLHKEAEILAVRSQLFQKSRLEGAKLEYENSQAEYERFKKVLEERLGTSLNNKVIDDVTFEVRDLPETTTPSEDGKGI